MKLRKHKPRMQLAIRWNKNVKKQKQGSQGMADITEFTRDCPQSPVTTFAHGESRFGLVEEEEEEEAAVVVSGAGHMATIA